MCKQENETLCKGEIVPNGPSLHSRMDSGLELERAVPAAYPQEHSPLEPRGKSDFFRDSSEPLSAFSCGPEEAPGLLQPDRGPAGSVFEPQEASLPCGEEVESLGRSLLQRSISQGSSHSLKLEEPRFDSIPIATKTQDLPDPVEPTEDKSRSEPFSQSLPGSNRATPPAEGLHKVEKLPLLANKQKSDMRWGQRSGTGRRDGPVGDRPVRRSGPIKKPVLRDMKEEREQRKEKEERHERGERGDRVKKEGLVKAPTAAAALLDSQKPPSEPKREQVVAPDLGDSSSSSSGKPRGPQMPAGTQGSASQEDKPDKPLVTDKHPEPKLPSRKESNLPPRAYRREERERDRERERERERERDKEREKDWPADLNHRGRGRGEYYSRGRSYRGSYGGRGRGSRGRSRGEYPYREPRSRSDLPLSASGGVGFRCREESETRSESSDFEVLPKRRRRRGSDTDSESEGHESASDTGASDREPSAKPSRPLRRELPEARRGSKPGGSSSFGPPHMLDKPGTREDEGRPKPGFLPKGEPSRRGRGGLYSRRGAGRERGGPRSVPLRRAGMRESSQWPSKPMETFRPEDAETSRFDNPAPDRRPPKYDGKKFGEAGPGSRERPRRPRPARPPRQDKPPRFRRLKEREAAVMAGEAASETPAPDSASPTLSKAPGSSVPSSDGAAPEPAPAVGAVPSDVGPTAVAAGSKSPDLSNQNSSDQANEEWETASESSDFNERREREERKEALESASALPAAAALPPQGAVTQGKPAGEGGLTPKRETAAAAKRSFSSQRPVDRQNRRGNSGPKSGRGYAGGKGERRGGSGAKAGRRGCVFSRAHAVFHAPVIRASV